jgi:coproporphyrinogen III oxidase
MPFVVIPVLFYLVVVALFLQDSVTTAAWAPGPRAPAVPTSSSPPTFLGLQQSSTSNTDEANSSINQKNDSSHDEQHLSLFQEFVTFLRSTQASIIQQVEDLEGSSGAKFTHDTWGMFETNIEGTSGGITRVLQGGDVIEKGACSLTLIQQGVLTTDRANAIRSRQDDVVSVQAGDVYSAAALSMVLHTRSPMVPTFRSDVRIFMVSNGVTTQAWFGGGADLTPYYLNVNDIQSFHQDYKQLAEQHKIAGYDYDTMKQACDDYFYLVARSEHRGTGGIFFDDMEATVASMEFVKDVAKLWMPSWLPIVEQHRNEPYTDQQRQWQLLRRGRYLEFNLLYDRGVKFGLANANPRVEGVMVSAPPLIAWEYNHVIDEGSEEHKLVEILKRPVKWV